MTRTDTSTAIFACDFAGCPAKSRTEGTIPMAWAQLQKSEKITEAVKNETGQVIVPEEWGLKTYHLCNVHIPKLQPD